MRNLLLMLLALIGAWRAEAQLDPRVAKLESDFFVEGDFRKVYGETVALSDRMEVMSVADNRVRVNLFRGLSEAFMEIADPMTPVRLEQVRAEAAEMGASMKRYEGLAQVAQTIYYTAGNPAKAVVLGAESCHMLLPLESVDNREKAIAQMSYGHALMMNGKAAKGFGVLTQALTTLQACGQEQSWIGAYVYAKRAAAQVMQRKGNEAIADIDQAFTCLEAVTDSHRGMDERDICLSLHPFGMALYVYTSCGLYDESIEVGKMLLGFIEYLKLQSSMDYADALQNIGAAYIFKKDFNSAMSYFERAKQAYESYGFVDTDSYRNLMRSIDWLKQQL